MVTVQEFEVVRRYVHNRIGMFFDDSKFDYVGGKIDERMNAVGLCSFDAYFQCLCFQQAQKEWQDLVNALTINETYFFREPDQFQSLVDEILPRVVASKAGRQQRIRILCLPCASGEEPYSIAMFLLENWAQVDQYQIEIFGADIDTVVLDAARCGHYSERSLLFVPPNLRARYFVQLDQYSWDLVPEIRASVDFRQGNLVDETSMRQFHAIDVVFCRNLLIYFDEAARQRAFHNLQTVLSLGGFLCLSAVESLDTVSTGFDLLPLHNGVVYRKRG